ncbi:MAG: PIN domain-containing protein [Thermoplasmatota archaeon]
MILDTSFIVDVMRRKAAALELLDEFESKSERLRIPVPVIYELWEGIERSNDPFRELEAVDDLLAGYSTVALSVDHAKRAGRISGGLIRRGQTIDDMDLLIAAIAIHEGETVVTRNERDFRRVPELRVRTYFSSS